MLYRFIFSRRYDRNSLAILLFNLITQAHTTCISISSFLFSANLPKVDSMIRWSNRPFRNFSRIYLRYLSKHEFGSDDWHWISKIPNFVAKSGREVGRHTNTERTRTYSSLTRKFAKKNMFWKYSTRTLIFGKVLNTHKHERVFPRKYRTLRTWMNANAYFKTRTLTLIPDPNPSS